MISLRGTIGYRDGFVCKRSIFQMAKLVLSSRSGNGSEHIQIAEGGEVYGCIPTGLTMDLSQRS